MFKSIGKIIGTFAGIAITPIAIALDISEDMVKEAIKQGYKTKKGIRRFYKLK